MSINIDIKYDPKKVETGKYDFWLKGKYFEAGDKTKEPFTVVLPPPNVTGKLHLGHAWDTTIQDMLIRRKRMQGYDTLWLPGCDHAGIATQAKVDQKLKEQGISRYDIGREAFLKEAYKWKDEYAKTIHEQWKALGLSLDYSKERFTLDDGMKKAVNHVFISLYNKGYLYRGERIINWDCEAKTALSNIEVEHIDTKGAFYYIKYHLVDNSGYLVVATTRPETMFADQALMVHPDDERFKAFIDKEVYIPTTNTKIKVIADSYVDKEFGTGVVKVTPAHDPNDFEVGLRHHLNMPLCMNEDGTMNEMALKYQGMDRFVCRKALVEDLKASGDLVKIEEIMHSVGHSERTHVIVEPRLSKQWFVKMDVLAKQVLDNKEYEFIPKRYKQVLVRWLTNINDWCVSRQLWWGHRIPAWYKGDEVVVSETCPGEGYIQDEDVLDTWFSSALWPFATLGWPENTDLYERYYPTSALVTGYDIIFFWVSRMLFQGIEFTGKAPFKDILIHGLIRDEKGRKMSKSLGNGVDPFDVIEKYGCDALRYFLNTNSAPGLDLTFDITKVESAWNYLNKIWNICRFVMLNLDDEVLEIDVTKLNMIDKYILTKLNEVIKNVNYNFDKYEFSEGAKALYNFVWEEFASHYVEYAKVVLQDEEAYKDSTKSVLYYVLMAIIKMLHPIIPFITEEIYQLLPHKEESIMISSWPEVKEEYNFIQEEKYVTSLNDLISTVRNKKAEAKKSPNLPIDLVIEGETNYINEFRKLMPYIIRFTKAKKLVFTNNLEEKEEYALYTLKDINVYILKSDLISEEEVINSLNSQLKTLENEIRRSEGLLNNEKFISKAPKEKVDVEKEKYKNYLKQYEDVKAHLIKLGVN